MLGDRRDQHCVASQPFLFSENFLLSSVKNVLRAYPGSGVVQL